MAYRLVTCPETAHLELLEYEGDPLGLLVNGCSRFGQDKVSCARLCAARLDRRARGTPELASVDDVDDDVGEPTEVDAARGP